MTGKKKSSLKFILLVSVFAVIFSMGNIASYLIDFQWFKELGYTEVFFKKLVTQVQFFIPVFVALFVLFLLFFKSISGHLDSHVKAAHSAKFKSLRNRIFALVSLAMAFVFSISIVSRVWYEFLIFISKHAFGINDPVFGKDIGFYVFTLPLLSDIHSIVLGIIVVLFVAALVYNAVSMGENLFGRLSGSGAFNTIDENGNVVKGKFGAAGSPQDPAEFVKVAVKQLSVLVGIFFITVGFGFILKMFGLLHSSSGIAYGAGFVDVNVTLPSYYIMAGVSFMTGLVFIFGGRRLKLRGALAGPVLLIAVTLISGIAEAGVQRFVVSPNERSKEQKYIQNNINYTNYAYGLDKVKVTPFPVDNKITRSDIEANIATVNNIPINDYRPARVIYNQIQGLKNYYTFSDIDIDRYMINGQYRQVFISARELVSDNIPGNTSGASSWINRYLKFTHGYGIAMSPVNEVTSSGQPRLFVKDMPVSSSVGIKIDRPEIYYGERTNDFAITNTGEKEFDYPDSNVNVETSYKGSGGIKLGFLNRIMFAVNTGKVNFLLSGDITADSKVLINRNIIERSKKLAPFLSYDSDPYIVVSGGKLYWIIDAYTKSSLYPYSEPISSKSSVNYIRNSVKVVVDAYNGDTDFYISDSSDPVIRTYSNIFKTLFKPMESMPSDLKSHVRYPQVMFEIQSNIFKKYHIREADSLYNKSDIWDIATQIYVNYGDGAGQQDENGSSDTTDPELSAPVEKPKQGEFIEPTYLIMRTPGSSEDEFILMVPYTPQGKNNMIAWLGVKCDEKEYGKMILYKFPSGQIVEGAMQIEGIISQDTYISPQLNLLATGGNSQVVRGTMLTIPVNNSLLYVEPIYVRAVNANALPELKKVIVYFNNQVVMEDTLEKALEKIFPSKKSSGSEASSQTSKPQQPNAGSDGVSQKDLILKANQLFTDAENAQRSGNWAEYGSKLMELKAILLKLAEEAKKIN